MGKIWIDFFQGLCPYIEKFVSQTSNIIIEYLSPKIKFYYNHYTCYIILCFSSLDVTQGGIISLNLTSQKVKFKSIVLLIIVLSKLSGQIVYQVSQYWYNSYFETSFKYDIVNQKKTFRYWVWSFCTCWWYFWYYY